MAIPKVFGIETEYGIAGIGQRDFNPVLASSLLISGYAGDLRRIRWDYEQESPLRDARGGGPSLVRDMGEDDVGLANVILPNGARYYVDHAHPEYSTPECATPRELVVHDRAGERILEASLDAFLATLAPGARVGIYKNNSDGKGNSYGTHENYLVDRSLPFADLVRDLIPFLVSRQVFTGAGKVGTEADGDAHGRPPFQISQRADFFEAEVGLETTLKRPIVNTRDEPHADADRYRRLHVIIGDANLCEVASLLKIGTASLVLRMIEDAFLPDLSLETPVAALRRISADPTCHERVALRDGRRLTAIQLQWEYLERAAKYVEQEGAAEGDAEVLARWEDVLGRLEDDPSGLHRELDWVAKHRLVEAYRERDGLDRQDPKLRLVDLQYHDVRRDRGLHARLEATGAVERLTSDEEVERAMREPPTTTRAWFRGECVRRFPEQLVAASWDSLIVDTGARALQRIPMLEPLRGTRAHVGDLLDGVEDAAGLVAALGGGSVGGAR
ncbi:MAG: depupylase/deamidase Dop [Actinomycetota bacterium]